MNAMNERQLRSNVNRTLAFGFFQVFLVLMPVIVPFFESRGLDMQDIFVLQALFGAVVLIMEVPSGYVADLFGRKQTLVIGAVFIAAGHTMLLFADGFWGLVLFEVGLGIGSSLVSGADLALIYDSELAIGEDPVRQQRVVGRHYAMHTASEAIAALLASALVLVSMDALVWAQVVAGWIPLAIAMTLREAPGDRMEGNDHLGNLLAITRHLFRNGAVLRMTFVAISVWSLTTFYAVWLLQKLWQEQGIELAHFGYLWAVYMIAAAIAGQFAERVERMIGTTALLIIVGVMPAVGYAGLAFSGAPGGVIVAFTFFIARGFGLVVLKNAFNRRVPSLYRATANSLVSFGFRGSFVVTGPFVGWALDAHGMQITLEMLAVGSIVIFATILVPLIGAVRTERALAAVNPG